MNSSHNHSTIWLRDSQLAPFVDSFKQHLIECRYASHTTNSYISSIAHFAHWPTQCDIDIHSIDEKVVQQFLDEHLPYCDCAKPVYRARQDLSAALGHLLVLLRTNAVIADQPLGMTPVDVELRYFNVYK